MVIPGTVKSHGHPLDHPRLRPSNPFLGGGPPPAYPLTTPLLDPGVPLLSLRGVGVNPLGYPLGYPGCPSFTPWHPLGCTWGTLFNPCSSPVVDRCKVLGTLTSPHRSRFGGRGFACRRRREPALAPQAFLCVPTGLFRRTPNSSKLLGLRAL